MVMSTAEKVAELMLAFECDNVAGSAERSVSELACIVGRERSQVCRMLKSLCQAQVLEQDPYSHRYRLGWRVRVLAAGAGDQILVHAARPILQALVARTGKVALLTVQEANRGLTVMREESQNILRRGGWIGQRSAMHYTATGRALMFDADNELVRALTADEFVAGSRSTPNAPRNFDELLERLRVERNQGYSVASEEIEAGLTSVSVPVRNMQGHLLAVLNVSGPTTRMIDRVEPTARLLMSASAAITKALGQRHTQDHEGAHRSRPMIGTPAAPAVMAQSRMGASADALMALTLISQPCS
jgi:IclR family transcriptional regulator, acetate operon repressor